MNSQPTSHWPLFAGEAWTTRIKTGRAELAAVSGTSISNLVPTVTGARSQSDTPPRDTSLIGAQQRGSS
jgi:hypothetical protein